MKKRWLIALLVCFVATATMAACKDETDKPTSSNEETSSSTIENSSNTSDVIIDVPDDCEVSLGDVFDYQTAAALYENTIVYPTVTITHNGESVATEEKAFTADKLGVYTITYTFVFGSETKTETRTVTCVDKAAPVITISEEFQPRYNYGDIVTLPEFNVIENTGEALTATVKVYKGEEEVTLFNNKFSIHSYDSYKVVATAKDASGNEGRKEYVLTVRGETEFEYFNSEEYVKKTIPVTQGEIAWNSNQEYVIEGEGSIHFTTNPNAMYPGFYFTDSALKVTDWKNVVSLSFWVYNASSNTFQFDLMSYTKQGGEVRVIQKYTVNANSWQYINVEGSMIYNAFNADTRGETLGIFMNGYDQQSVFASMNFYFDAFEIHKTAMNKDYAINVQDISYFKGEVNTETIDVLTTADIGNDVNMEEMEVTITDANGITSKVALKDNKFSIRNKVGEYTITYLYKDGVNGNAVTQKVSLSSEYQTLSTRNDFEGATAIDNNQFNALCGVGVFSYEADPTNPNNQTLLFSNDIGGGLYSAIKLGLTAEQIAVFNPETDTIRFKLYVEKNGCNATKMNMRIKSAGTRGNGVDGQGAGTFLKHDDGLFDENSANYNVGVWKTWETDVSKDAALHLATMQAVKSGGGLWIRLEIIGGYHCGYKAYFDDVEVVKNGQLTQTVEEFVKGDLAGAFETQKSNVSVADLVVKNGNGETVALTSGKLLTAGEYEVIATVTINGVTKKYNVWVNFKS